MQVLSQPGDCSMPRPTRRARSTGISRWAPPSCLDANYRQGGCWGLPGWSAVRLGLGSGQLRSRWLLYFAAVPQRRCTLRELPWVVISRKWALTLRGLISERGAPRPAR